MPEILIYTNKPYKAVSMDRDFLLLGPGRSQVRILEPAGPTPKVRATMAKRLQFRTDTYTF